MIRKRKILLAVLFVAVLTFTGVQSLQASDWNRLKAQSSYCNITVGIYSVTERNDNDVLGDGTVSYNSAAHTLYLRNAHILGTAGLTFGYRSNGSAQPLTIVVEGDCSIGTYDCSTWDSSAYGIRTTSFAYGPDLIIRGNGTLSVTATSTSHWGTGIAVGGNLIIKDNVTLKVTVNKACEGGSGFELDNADTKVQIGGSAKVIVSGVSRAFYEKSPAFLDGYVPAVKAGSSSKNITVNKINPSGDVYTNNSFVYIARQVMKQNPMTAKVKLNPVTVKSSALKNKDVQLSAKSVFSVSGAQGEVTYAKVSGPGKISVSKSGNITLKNGLAKKTYQVKVSITAAGNEKYLPKTKYVILKIRVS